MKIRTIVIMTGCLLLILLVATAGSGRAKIPKGTQTLAALLKNPFYETEISVYGEVSLLGELFCPCFVLSSGGKSIEVWYSLLTEGDGTPWPTVSVDGFQNRDVVIVTGELRMDVKNVIWAVVINKGR